MVIYQLCNPKLPSAYYWYDTLTNHCQEYHIKSPSIVLYHIWINGEFADGHAS